MTHVRTWHVCRPVNDVRAWCNEGDIVILTVFHLQNVDRTVIKYVALIALSQSAIDNPEPRIHTTMINDSI